MKKPLKKTLKSRAVRASLCCIVLLLTFSTTNAQTTETDAIKATINNLFAAMRNADSTALKNCLAPGAILQSVGTTKEGKIKVSTSPFEAFATSIGKLPKNAADERIVFDIIKIDANLATVWTPYRFYYQGKFSHCGVNSFQMVKLADGWKIQYTIDTRRKDACIDEASATDNKKN